MKLPQLNQPIVLCLIMLLGAGLAVAGRPTKRIADSAERVNLEAMVPAKFGDWRIDDSIAPIRVAPDVQAKLDQIYNQVLSRTYVNDAGKRVMLSIAYGGDQSDAMQVHRPEVCYAAQGFEIAGAALASIATQFGRLAVKRLLARSGPRNEPITYWIVVGDEVSRGTLGTKLTQLKYGLTGRIPDGVLVRVSSIDRNDAAAYSLQERFVQGLLAALAPHDRKRFFGREAGS